MIEHDCYITALHAGLPLVLVGFLGQIFIYIFCRLIEEHLWPRIKTSSNLPTFKKDHIVESTPDISNEESEIDSVSELSSEDSSETQTPVVSSAAQDELLTLANDPVSPSNNSGSAQQKLAEHNLQFSVLHENIMALVPLVEQKVATTSEISETNKKAFLNLISAFANANTPSSIKPISSNSILDSPRDVSNEQQREEESQFLMKTLATLIEPKQ